MPGADDLDWDDLRYFLRAVDAKTLAGAARTLHVDHTTIGRRLTALERVFGAPLVVRGPDGLQLTPLGEKLAPLVADVERAVLAVCDAASSEVRVRLAVPSGFTRMFAPGLADLRRTHPELSIELVSGARPVDLGRGEAELAVRVGPVGDEALVARRLCEVGAALYGSPAYVASRPIADPNDLSGHALVGYDEALSALPAARWLDEHAGGATIVLRSREMTDMLAAAASGIGLAVLPCHMGDAEPGLIRVVPDVVARRGLSLVYRRELRLSEPVRVVMQLVVDVVHAHAAELAGDPRT